MSECFIISDFPELYSHKRLVNELSARRINSTIISPSETSIRIGEFEELPKCDFILHRSTGIKNQNFDLSLSEFLSLKKAKVVNPLTSLQSLRGKEKQALFFLKHHFPFIPTFSFRGRPSEKLLEEITHFFSRYKISKENYILKTICGSKGIGVNLIRGKDSLSSFLETFWAIGDQDFILQPFIEIDEEYRLFVIDGKIVGALKRTPHKNEFRSNSHRGSAENLELPLIPPSLHNLAYSLFEKTKANYAGIDLLKSKNEFLIIEYNLVPGFEQMEKKTGKNIADLILNSMIGEKNESYL